MTLNRRKVIMAGAAFAGCRAVSAHSATADVSAANTALFLSPFSSESLWNARPINPKFADGVINRTTNWAMISDGDFGAVLYPARVSDPPVIIRGVSVIDEIVTRDILLPHFPAGVTIPEGSDHEVVIYDSTTQLLHSFWQMQRNDGTWTARSYACERIDGLGWSSPSRPYNIRAAGCSPVAGALRAWELNEPYPKHALAMSLDARSILADSASSGGPVFPATGQDAGFPYRGSAPNAWPMGTRFMLASSFDVDSLSALGARKIAQTLQQYGAYLIDTSPGGCTFLGEYHGGWSLASAATDPFTGVWRDNNDLAAIVAGLRSITRVEGWLNGNGNPFKPIPWAAMQLLSMRGPWTVVTGSANGAFDTAQDYFIAPATGAYSVMQRVLYEPCRTSPQGWWWNWAHSNGWFTTPTPGQKYLLTINGAGSLSASFSIRSPDSSLIYFNSSITLPAQQQTFTWPNQPSFATIMQIVNPGGGGSIRFELTKV
jgi:hypothetical protein